MVVDCKLESSKYSSKEVLKIDAELQGVFSALHEKEKIGVSNTYAEKKSMSNTLRHATLKIYGGRPPRVILLQSLTHEMFSEWTESLKQNCSELEHTVKLRAYYDLAKGEQSKSLKEATLAYLEAGNKREAQSIKMTEETVGCCSIQ